MQCNVRIIVVMYCDLEKMIVDDKFCEDLYYCLNVFLIDSFVLCECCEDILLLLQELII